MPWGAFAIGGFLTTGLKLGDLCPGDFCGWLLTGYLPYDYIYCPFETGF